MGDFFLHIGAPRTGTTVLQKYIFPQAVNTYLISKEPFKSGVQINTTLGLTSFDVNTLLSKALETEIILYRKSNNKFILDLLLSLVQGIAVFDNQDLKTIFQQILDSIHYQVESNSVLLSSERLVETSASLDCYSRHQKGTDKEFNIYTFLQNIPDHLTPKIILCLREPVSYLASKYFRTVIQRQRKRLRYLTPDEYISKQIELERIAPGTSALTVATHSSFVKELAKFAIIKVIGFQDLIKTSDVFSLMGIQGQPQCRFIDYPSENSQSLAEVDKNKVYNEIILSLKRNEYYETIISSKMYD